MLQTSHSSPKPSNGPVVRLLGPGLVTGAADDDPSGIATYSQAGAQFGYSLLWTVFRERSEDSAALAGVGAYLSPCRSEHL
jgi:hypothetical protein